MVADVDMGAFWDRRARENAAYFVEDRLPYTAPDLDVLWAGGEEIVAGYERRLGLTVRPEDVVVEIGCGIGRVTRPLAARARAVRALDVSGEMLARARALNSHLGNVDWVLGDGRTLTGVADGSADGVFSHVVFQHLPDPAITLGYAAEMGRVLRPGGWAAFQVSTDPSVHRRRRGARAALRRLLAAAGRAPRGTAHPAWLGSAVDLAELRAAAASAGLTTERVTGAGTQFCLVLLQRPVASSVESP